MAWSGGTFTRANGSTEWQDDAALGIGIEAGLHDAQDNDLATGINNCLTKDGQNTPTANLPMGGFKHTGAGSANANGQYTTYEQLRDSTFVAALASVAINNTANFSQTNSIYANDAAPVVLRLQKSRGATIGTNTIVQNGDIVGRLEFMGANGTGFDALARIHAVVDGTPGASGDMPGALVFSTTADASATPAERMRIDDAGNVGIGRNNPGTFGNLEVGGSAYAATSINSSSGSGAVLILAANGTSETRINTNTNHPMVFYTNNTQRAVIAAAGNVGVNATSPQARLHVGGATNSTTAAATYVGTVQIDESGITALTSAGGLEFKGSTTGSGYGSKIVGFDDGALVFASRVSSATWSERLRITNTGSLIMSATSAVFAGDFSNATANSKNAIMTATANDNSLVDIIPNGTATVSGIYCNNNSTRTNSGYVAITSSSTVNSLVSGRNGTGTYLPLISITGGSERWRVNTSGDFIVANTVNNFYDSGVNTAGAMMGANGVVVASVDNSTPLIINRKASDTTLVDFRRDGVNVGSITVSAGVVTYGPFAGYHWSQLEDGTAPTIPVGTVMESINELCEWPDETEDRLPKCKVSDTVASSAVYGVFSSWDTDWTATNDMSIVSVGAYFCRVPAGTVLAIGDLLESDGNGMAQVQTDDIIKSSTIGKVTALTQSHVEADGSFCVPTVLYCG